MSNLTIRIEEELKKEAFEKADKLGVSLTLVIKTALRNFSQNSTIHIGESEEVCLSSDIQDLADQTFDLLADKK